MFDFVFNLTRLKLMSQRLWRDEGFSYLMAKKEILEMFSLTAKDFSPPFYYILLHYWMKIFGSSEVVLRSLSLIFYAATIYVAHIFIINIFKIKGRWVWIYTALFALNPLLGYYAFEARMYSLFGFLSLLSFLFFYQKKTVPYIFVSILGLYTHYFFLFIILTQIVFTVIFDNKNLFKKLIPETLSIAFFIPWLFFTISQLKLYASSFWIKKTTVVDFWGSLAVLFTGYERNFYQYYHSYLIPISLFFLCVLGYFLIKQSKKNFPTLLFLWTFLFYYLVFFVSLFKPLYVPRYLIFSAIGFNLLIIYILNTVNRRARIIVLSIIILITGHYWALQIQYRLKGDVRKTIAEIKSSSTERDFLYVTDPSLYLVASYYFDENRLYIYNKTIQDTGYYIGIVLIPSEKFINKLPLYPAKAFILRNDHTYEVYTSL